MFRLLVFSLVVLSTKSQDLNILPNLVAPFLKNAQQLPFINLMANISEKLFHLRKIGLNFEPTMLRNDYDFIIVGGGTAGCVIANRLSENPKWNILMLEAGQPESTLNFVPAATPMLIKSTYDWGFIAEKTPGSCTASENERCTYHAGRALGGSSTINYMIFTRGSPRDYDEWEAAGNEGWGYEGVLPYFKKMETANIEGADPKYRGLNGPLVVGYPPYRSALTDFFVAAAKEQGYQAIDVNAESQLGVSYLQSNVPNGRRMSSASAYIHPIYKKRKNLHILTSAMVSKVIIDKDTKTALGVKFKRDGQKFTVYAKKEVILSAGALRSPHLLMLSGIGPKAHLESFDIKVIKDLPVGERYSDHTLFPALVFLTNTTNLSFNLKSIGALEVLEFIEGRGKLTSPVSMEGIMFGKMKDSPLLPEQPDYELLMIPGSLSADMGTAIAPAFRLKQDVYDQFLKPLEVQSVDKFTLLVQQMRPKSVGHIKLQNKNINTPPMFYHNFYTHPYDVEAQLAGVREGIRLASANIFQGIGATMYPTKVKGCQHLTFNSDDYWRCAIQATSVSVYHPTGSCRMGPEESGETVVDSKLRVHGIKRLRVADNSVMPNIICGHTQSVAMMIGEKFSDIIKEEWRDG